MSDSESENDDNNRKYQQIPLNLEHYVARTPYGGSSVPSNGGFTVKSYLDYVLGNYDNFA